MSLYRTHVKIESFGNKILLIRFKISPSWRRFDFDFVDFQFLVNHLSSRIYNHYLLAQKWGLVGGNCLNLDSADESDKDGKSLIQFYNNSSCRSFSISAETITPQGVIGVLKK